MCSCPFSCRPQPAAGRTGGGQGACAVCAARLQGSYHAAQFLDDFCGNIWQGKGGRGASKRACMSINRVCHTPAGAKKSDRHRSHLMVPPTVSWAGQNRLALPCVPTRKGGPFVRIVSPAALHEGAPAGSGLRGRLPCKPGSAWGGTTSPEPGSITDKREDRHAGWQRRQQEQATALRYPLQRACSPPSQSWPPGSGGRSRSRGFAMRSISAW